MAENSNAGFVHCTKCQNFLQELHDYVVYKHEASKNKALDETCRLRGGKRDGIFREDKVNFGGSSPRLSNKEVMMDDKRYVKQHSFKASSKDPVVSWALNNDSDMNMYRSMSVSSSRADRIKEHSKFARSSKLSDMKFATATMSNDPARFLAFRYPDDGPLSYKPDSFFHDKPPKKFVCPERPRSTRVEDVGEDQSQILRILDELKEQIGKTLQVSQNPNEVPIYNHAGQPFHDYFARDYMDFTDDSFASYPWGTFYHGPRCSCLHCRNNDWQVSGKRKLVKDWNNSNFRSHANPIDPRHQGHIPVNGKPPMQANVGKSDIDSDIDGFHRSRPRRMIMTLGRKRFYHPIAGGAPFVTCYKCLELLKLPRSIRKLQKNQQKLRCGVCSTIIVFEVVNRDPVTYTPGHSKQRSTTDKESYSNTMNEHFPMDDLDHPGFDIHMAGKKERPASCGKSKIFRVVEAERNSIAPPSVPFEEEKMLNYVFICRESPTSAEKVFDNGEFLKIPASSSERSVDRKGNRIAWAKEDKIIMNEGKSHVISEKNELLEAEVDVAIDEYPNTNSSQDSMAVGKEKDQTRINKGRETSLIGLIKRSFRDLSRTNHSLGNERSKVSVNGQAIPESMVKKAEKKAGPIYPGDYWYDFQGGFWGVMGQPCLGIIPQFIEEFNYPMPKNCAAGNTGVFVNGRELNQKDLNILVGRGLPTTRDKSYIIDISGKIVDKSTNTELGSLGKLAPTVEALKRGFGMQVRRAVV